MQAKPRRKALTVVVALTVVALVALPVSRRLLWHWESNPVLRGRLVAERQGCYDCHRPFGSGEIPNPGSRWGSVPQFGVGNSMMYAESCEEIGEFIRLGAPRAWLDEPKSVSRLESQRLRMPAYGDLLSEDALADVTAFACAVEGVGAPGGEAAAAGRALARKHGCLGCHGVEGSGGLPNPGSLGGFIPGFTGRNFADLVADESEFQEWVSTGTSSRLEENPLLRYFWSRQTISMPAYGETLTDEEVSQLWAWVASRARDSS